LHFLSGDFVFDFDFLFGDFVFDFDFLFGDFDFDFLFGDFVFDFLLRDFVFDFLFGDFDFDFLFGDFDFDFLFGDFDFDFLLGDFDFDFLFGDIVFDFLFGDFDFDFLFGDFVFDFLLGDFDFNFLFGDFVFDFLLGDFSLDNFNFLEERFDFGIIIVNDNLGVVGRDISVSVFVSEGVVDIVTEGDIDDDDSDCEIDDITESSKSVISGVINCDSFPYSSSGLNFFNFEMTLFKYCEISVSSSSFLELILGISEKIGDGISLFSLIYYI